MDSCQQFKLLISDFIEGGLSPENQQQMEYHFQECIRCTTTTQQLKNLINDLRKLPKIKVSPNFETILRARISVESALARRKHENFFASLQFRIPAYAVSAVLIILGLLSVFSRFDRADRLEAPEAYVNQEWYGGVQQADRSNQDLRIYVIEKQTVYGVTSISPAATATIYEQDETNAAIDSAQSIQRSSNTINHIQQVSSPIY